MSQGEEGAPGSSQDARHAGSFTLITIASRALGMVRSVVMGALLGGTMGADAFWASFKLVNFFRLFLGEGAMGNAMMPVLKEIEAKGEDWREFSARCARTVVALCLVFLVLGALVLDPLLGLYLPGMSPEGRAMTAHLTAIMSPYLLLIGLVSVLMTPLQAHRLFRPVAGHPLLFNLAMLAAGGVALALGAPAETLAYGVVAGGVLQAWLLLRGAGRLGIPVLSPGAFGLADPAMRKVAQLMVPSLLGVALVRMTTLVDTQFASWLETGSLSYLQYGAQLFNAALGIAGVGVSTVYFTALAETRAQGDAEGFAGALSRAGGLILVLAVPATVLAVAFPESIAGIYVAGNQLLVALLGAVSRLLGRGDSGFTGRFGAADLIPTAQAVRWYFLALPCAGLFQLFSKGLYARQQQRQVVQAGLATALLNILLDWLWVGPYGVAGLAAATSAALAVNLGWLGWLLRDSIPGRIWAGRLGRTMGPALLAAAAGAMLPLWARQTPWMLPPLYAAVYLGLLHAGNTEEYGLLRAMLQRRRGAPPQESGGLAPRQG